MLSKLFLVLRIISSKTKSAIDVTVHAHIVRKLIKIPRWLISVRTAKKENFPSFKLVKVARFKTVCFAGKREFAKSVS